LGEEIIYVLEGSLEYQIEGQPAKTFNAGPGRPPDAVAATQ
jgi:quercetin dioxygenase-like cupin family protein